MGQAKKTQQKRATKLDIMKLKDERSDAIEALHDLYFLSKNPDDFYHKLCLSKVRRILLKYGYDLDNYDEMAIPKDL